jgi:hypothetical protein
MTKLYNIIYKTEVLHEKLTIEEVTDKLQDYADMFYDQQDDRFNPSFLEMEEIIDAG